MNMNNKVSVIIPIYNAYDYLEDCLEMLIAQTYMNIEVIMINDGSTDESEKICQRYALRDKRFILISQENKGVCVARNLGIKHATGKWIVFADADDYYYKDGIEKMVRLISSKNWKVALCNSDVEHGNSTKPLMSLPKTNEYSFLPIHHYALWGYIFDFDFILNSKIQFIPGIEFSEDRLFLYELSFYVDNICISNESVYFHRSNNTSVCNYSSGFKKAKGQLHAAIELKKLVFNTKNENIISYVNKEITHVVRMAFLQYFSSNIKLSEIKILYNIYTNNIGSAVSFMLNSVPLFIIANKRKLFK